MEEEKDDRQYGSVSDSLARLEAGRRIEPRWAETMKFVSNFLEMGEYASIAGSALLYDAVTSPEQRDGYLAQVEEAVRHANELGYMKKYFASQYEDPAGFTEGRRHRHGDPLFWNNRQQACEAFIAGDPVQVSLNLQMVAEACFSNPLVVAMTQLAAADGGGRIIAYVDAAQQPNDVPVFAEGEVVGLEGPFGEALPAPVDDRVIVAAGYAGLPQAVAIVRHLGQFGRAANTTVIADIAHEASGSLRALIGAAPDLYGLG